MNDRDAKVLIEEVKALKMLSVLQLMQQGVKQRQIAAILGVSEATVSRMIPRQPKGASKAEVNGGDESDGRED
jgi:predicted transcriptional regulator